MTYKELIFMAMTEPELSIFVTGEYRSFLDVVHSELCRRVTAYGIKATIKRDQFSFSSGSIIRFATWDSEDRIRGFKNTKFVSGYGLDAEERAKAEASR